MKWNITQDDNFIIAQKPSGFSTHAPDLGKHGFVEILNEGLQQNLHVVHRLDKETSGLLLLAQTPQRAEEFRQAFQNKHIQKQYLFICSKVPTWQMAIVHSTISKDKNQFVSRQAQVKTYNEHKLDDLLAQEVQISNSQNSENWSSTVFVKKQSHDSYCALEAYPITGRSHQIRLHAQDLEIAILGDLDHGGAPFTRLCLHAHQLTYADKKFHSPAPEYFRDLSLLNQERHLGLYSALHRRQMLWQWDTEESLRLFHQEGSPLEIDQYGEVLWFYVYDEANWNENYLNQLKSWAKFLGKKYVIRRMQNRGKDSQENVLRSSEGLPPRWVATEEGKKFEVRTDSGLSPGLFLDQRQNRSWLAGQVKNKSVLNLFSYTSLFSVAAAQAGASSVTTVDLSKSFIEWSKRNFELNELPTAPHEFWYQDVFVYLKGAQKRGKKFDWIILDPPSFSRSKEGVFKIDKQLPDLLALCLPLLNSNGFLHFTLNYEQWTSEDLGEQIEKALLKLKANKKAKVIKTLRSGWDFEFPNSETLMKGFVIQFA